MDGLLKKTGRKREDFAKLVLYAPDARLHGALARQLRLPEAAAPKEPPVARAGNTGTASCLLGLAAALEEARQNFRLYGRKCQDCGAVSYPRCRLCWQCSSSRLADQKISRRGRVFTFMKDHLVPNPDPPTVMVSADLEGGGRFYAQLTDCDPASVTFEMPVELTSRRPPRGRGVRELLLEVPAGVGRGDEGLGQRAGALTPGRARER